MILQLILVKKIGYISILVIGGPIPIVIDS